MPRTPLSEEEVQRFQAKMCEVATAHFARNGYPGVTMRALANQLGCSPMTPYRYFENKQAILAAVRNAAFIRFGEDLRSAAAGEADPFERIVALSRAYVALAKREPDRYRVMFLLNQRDFTDFPIADAAGAEAWQTIVEAMRAAVEAGAMEGDLLTLAHVFWAAVHGPVSLYLDGKLVLGRSVEELSDEIVCASLRGLRPGRASKGDA